MTALEIVPVDSSAPAKTDLPGPKQFRLPGHLSFSALSTYAECGERYRIERGHGVRGPSYWNTVGGTAVHHVTELADRAWFGEDVEVLDFEAAFEEAIAEEVERSGFPESALRASGRASKAWPDKQNKSWWLTHGPLYVSAWIRWRENTGYRLWETPWGEPGIEVPIEVHVGGEPFVGYIDRVFVDPNDGTGVPVDLKCGNHEPKSSLQLGTYGVGLARDYGLPVRRGGFWMAKNYEKDGDGLKYMEDLSRFTPEYVDVQFAMAWRGIRAGVFLPSPGMMCKSCSVRDFCTLMGGERADELPALEVSSDMKQITSG
ncbi:putative RecB family exonuclease [Haloactinopolyspora alba]|uniref:Putative RecB family exonuclease n=1 Tax=Haloactinopolyspora alba TaxID=648780 RepID=A0A2P8E3V9_9ACTN|nr:PD-(D/E)XK nuclease family protein [Haloactinopolyspora alba]PSL04149.1 putative RecB family exonuclease [Haloactinopolyspora alba]